VILCIFGTRLCVCMFVCVCERERERETDRVRISCVEREIDSVFIYFKE
jgi:hypothetical protein